MITRGIIEKSVDQYHVKVRIPSIDRMNTSSVHTSTDNLTNAVLATLPGCEVQLQPGDVVIVAIDKTDDCATILGYLYREASVNKHCRHNMSSLSVDYSTVLSRDTTIGDVKSTEIAHLCGVKENIQKQLDDIQRRLSSLEGH